MNSKPEEFFDSIKNQIESIENNQTRKQIYDLFIHNIIPEIDEKKSDSDLCFYLAEYYYYINKDHENYRKYDLIAAKLGNSRAMVRVAIYYKDKKNTRLYKS